MNDSKSPGTVTPQEIAFIEQYCREQLHFLGHPDHSPASVWLRQQGLTNLNVGRFALALQAINVRCVLDMQAPEKEFQSPWRDRDEFLSRLEQVARIKPTSPPERKQHEQ